MELREQLATERLAMGLIGEWNDEARRLAWKFQTVWIEHVAERKEKLEESDAEG